MHMYAHTLWLVRDGESAGLRVAFYPPEVSGRIHGSRGIGGACHIRNAAMLHDLELRAQSPMRHG
jgi:hypothetical protein